MGKVVSSIKTGIKHYIKQKKKVYVNTYNVGKDNLLNEKVAVVTGATSGIGLEIARVFSNHGAKIIIVGRNNDKLERISKEIKNCDCYKLDIRDIKEQNKFVETILKKYGKIDILVNNAGISNHESDFLSVSEESFDDQFATNLRGPYFLTQEFIKKQQCDMNIIFVSSERGSQCDFLPYGLTKVALNSLVEGLSYRFIENNIRVNAIAPGVTASNIVKVDTKGNMAASNYASGRYFLPSEVAEVALFLASDLSKCISGEIIHTNDGNHLNSYLNLYK